jgi:plastocyanin
MQAPSGDRDLAYSLTHPLVLHRIPWILLAPLAACGASSGTTDVGIQGAPQPSPVTATVNATPSIAFTPATAVVAPGGTVTFAFGSVAHNVFFDVAAGAPADITGSNANASVARTFSTAGTYAYACHIHPGMVGTIVVSQTSTTQTSGGDGGYP